MITPLSLCQGRIVSNLLQKIPEFTVYKKAYITLACFKINLGMSMTNDNNNLEELPHLNINNYFTFNL